jgi:hypothetical protein
VNKISITLECDPYIAQYLLAFYELFTVDSEDAAGNFQVSPSAVTAARALTYMRDKVTEVYVDTKREVELEQHELREFARLLGD